MRVKEGVDEKVNTQMRKKERPRGRENKRDGQRKREEVKSV